jgi:hypothetical protein
MTKTARSAVNLNDKSEIDSALAALVSAKNFASTNGEEEQANQIWCDIQALKIAATFVAAIKNIKQKKYRDAWCELEQCEIICKFLEKNSSAEFFQESGAQFIEIYVGKWQSLYPYCVFASPAILVGYYTCSICGHKIRPRSRCLHVRGQIYNGELCSHQAHDLEIREISIVTKPVQKYSVMHDDETLDFSLLEYLCSHINSPFDEWEAHWTTRKFPRARFKAVTEDQKCPCQGGGFFGQCCSEKTEIEIPHVDFALKNGLNKQAEVEKFPY